MTEKRKPVVPRTLVLERISTATEVVGPLATIVAAAGAAIGEPITAIAGGVVAGLSQVIGSVARRSLQADRRTRAATAMLRYLAHEAFTVPDNHGQDVPANLPGFRVTVFWPDDKRPDVIRPRLRAYHRQEPFLADSTVEFESGQNFAGAAWKNPGMPFSRDNLLSIDDTQGTAEERHVKWRTLWTSLGVPPNVVHEMGRGSGNDSSYIKHTRSVACFGTFFGSHQFVISVDSIYREAFADPFLKARSLGETFLFAKIVGQEMIRDQA